MSEQESKGLVYRFIEIVNGGEVDVLGEVIAEGYVQHNPMFPDGLEAVQDGFRMFATSFPDLRATVEGVAADGDQVVIRVTWRGTHRGEFMGVPATGKEAEWGSMDWWRVEDGRLAEHWDQVDWAGLLQQLS